MTRDWHRGMARTSSAAGAARVWQRAMVATSNEKRRAAEGGEESSELEEGWRGAA